SMFRKRNGNSWGSGNCMPPEDEDFREVSERPSESKSDAGVAQLAREGQTKGDEQKSQDLKQDVLRKNYDSNSSVSLPRIDLGIDDSGLVAKSGDKLMKLDPPTTSVDVLKAENPDGSGGDNKSLVDGLKSVVAGAEKLFKGVDTTEAATGDAAPKEGGHGTEAPKEGGKPSDATAQKPDAVGDVN